MSAEFLELSAVELHGTARQMGEQFGEATRAEMHELLTRRLNAALEFAREESSRHFTSDQVLALARQCLPITEKYDPTGYEEFLGIARGAGMSPEHLFIMQGYTDFRDVLSCHGPTVDGEGCSSIIVTREHAANHQLLLGQTWDLQTDNMPYVRLVHRRPSDGSPETWSLTLTGCLTLIGLNSEGIAVGTTNLRTTDARPGVQYLSILHRAIRSRTLEEVIASVRSAPRSAAHYFFAADAHGNAVGLECSAADCETLYPHDGLLIHCNHALTPSIRAIESPFDQSSTLSRQARCSHLLSTTSGLIDVETIRGIYADHDGGNNAICRHDVPPSGVSTNACVIISPELRQMHACRGQAHRGVWRTVNA